MIGEKLLVLLLSVIMSFQLIAEPVFYVSAPDQVNIMIDEDGEVTIFPEDPAIFNSVSPKAVAVTSMKISLEDGWTFVPFDKLLSGAADARMISVRLNGVEVVGNGMIYVNSPHWVIKAGSRLPLDFDIKFPGSLPREDAPRALTIRYTFDWAEDIPQP